MSEVGGQTELQLLEAEVTILKKQLDGVKNAEPASTACARIVSSIKNAESKDGFLVGEGGPAEHNQFHTQAGAASDGGCCVLL